MFPCALPVCTPIGATVLQVFQYMCKIQLPDMHGFNM